jgi:hypothetical protein
VFPLSRRGRSFALLPPRIVILVVLLGCLAITTHSATSVTASTASTVRINSGGAAVTDVEGHRWQADSSYVGGQTASTTAAIAGSPKQQILQNERFGMSAYRIPVANASYKVTLLESEHYFTKAGQRVFSVTAEGATELTGIDIYARAGGKNKALWLSFYTTVSDGKLDLGFRATRDKAKVDGIVVEPSGTPAPSVSALWGMNDNASFDGNEQKLGRKFAVVREYRRLDQKFVSTRMQSLVNSGHSLAVSVRAANINTHIKYAAITAGKFDTAIVAGLSKLNTLATPAYFIFQHEADSTDAKSSCTSTSDAVCGSQFVSAWKHIYNLAQARNLKKVIFTWTVTSYGFSPQSSVRNKYYWPGTSYTHWIGVDAYNGGCAGNWYGSFKDMLAKTIAWTQANAPGKSIMLPEWGATEGASSSDKAVFFNDVPSSLQEPGYKNIKALVYWNEKPTSCDFRVNTSTPSYNAYKALGLKPVMSAAAK